MKTQPEIIAKNNIQIEDMWNGQSFNDENDYEFGQNNKSVYDYSNYNEDSKYTPERNGKIKKPQFLSQQQKRGNFGSYGNNAISESKLPPSLRWALESDSYDAANDIPVYERNPKVNTHLKPIKNGINRAYDESNSYNNTPVDIKASAGNLYGTQENGINRIPSIKKLSSQKTRRLQPLRK